MACDASFLKHYHTPVIHFGTLHFKNEETLYYSAGPISRYSQNIHVLDKVDFRFVPTNACTERKASVILKKIFGFTGFRDGQFESIGVLRNNKDCIALLPTGGGKSVIFIMSAILSFGVTFVVEPTKFLMEEQVKRLQNLNVSAFFINSLSSETISNIVTALGDLSMMYAIVFTSPE